MLDIRAYSPHRVVIGGNPPFTKSGALSMADAILSPPPFESFGASMDIPE